MRHVRHLLVGLVLLGVPLSAQLRVQPVAEHSSETALRLALRTLRSSGTFMQTTAHPDDEDNGLLAMLGYGRGLRTVLVTATRGDGGQNEIGPELFQALAVLRTEELLAAHRFDGAEQLFTRAVDFGYSFSIEESLERWGREQILGDLVRHIRAVRPDVIAGFLCDGGGGGQHHQASALLTREAFRAAADPLRFPEHLRAGLRPWQARRLFCTEMRSFMTSAPDSTVPALRIRDVFEPLLGRMYGELGIEARSMHKCQGMSQLLPLPGESPTRIYRLQDTTIDREGAAPADLFDGIDTSLEGLTRFAPQASTLASALTSIAETVAEAERGVAASGQFAAAAPLAKGLARVRWLRESLPSMPLDAEARYEIEFRLARKELDFERALVLAQGLRIEAIANDGLLVVGQPLEVSLLVRNSGPSAVALEGVRLTGLDAPQVSCPAAVEPGAAVACRVSGRVASLPLSTPYWEPRSDSARYDFPADVPFGAPFRPSPFTARFAFRIAGAPIGLVREFDYRYDHIVAGEKRMEPHVVPAFAVTLAPEIAVIPAAAAATGDDAARELEVTVVHHHKGAADGVISLEVPRGWRALPAVAPVRFTREDEAVTVKFSVTPPAGAPVGDHRVKARVSRGGETFTLGYDVIEYPHVHRRHLVKPAETRLEVIEVTLPADLDVGYVTGVGDQVPAAIQQLGGRLSFVGPDELAAGDLSRYDVIVTGVRAYERRADLRANNHRLLEYASRGGVVLVQYNKFEFNAAQYGPLPAKVSANRVTDERAPVTVLMPDHPVFTRPNPIGPEAWTGWVQERGLYFLGDRDAGYTDLVALEDPFELNAGRKTGALVEVKVGQGRWIYIGLGLWRQLPAGTPGAYRLLANLLALGSR